MDENFIDDYDYEHVQKKLMNSIRYEGYEEGYEKGVEEGIKEGIEQGIKENSTGIAKRMLLKDIDINTISSITKLDVEEINKLKLEM